MARRSNGAPKCRFRRIPGQSGRPPNLLARVTTIPFLANFRVADNYVRLDLRIVGETVSARLR